MKRKRILEEGQCSRKYQQRKVTIITHESCVPKDLAGALCGVLAHGVLLSPAALVCWVEGEERHLVVITGCYFRSLGYGWVRSAQDLVEQQREQKTGLTHPEASATAGREGPELAYQVICCPRYPAAFSATKDKKQCSKKPQPPENPSVAEEGCLL